MVNTFIVVMFVGLLYFIINNNLLVGKVMVISDNEAKDYGLTKGKDNKFFEICSDEFGKRIWINADDGSAVARFNISSGVDIHNTVTDQLAGASECLWCTHGKPDYVTWCKFILEVEKHFGLKLSIDSIDVGLLDIT
jgi:hypothetical protein